MLTRAMLAAHFFGLQAELEESRQRVRPIGGVHVTHPGAHRKQILKCLGGVVLHGWVPGRDAFAVPATV